MKPIGPQLVCTPDGRTGCLVARMGLSGCVSFGDQRVLETYPLMVLGYLWFVPAPENPRERRKRTPYVIM